MTFPFRVLGNLTPAYKEILTTDALQFLSFLHTHFNDRRLILLKHRLQVQLDIDRGIFPSFCKETEAIRGDPTWMGAKPAPGLIDRRVEITGPVDRKMVINALNCGSTQFMADFEDSNAPTWDNCMDGQVNLRDAVSGTISFKNEAGKVYKLKDKIGTLLIRPRGWHLEEGHLTVDGQPMSASLVDFGLYFYHNAKKSIAAGFGPYFYLPKMEHYLEARLWNDVFNASQDYLGISRGTIRATVLIETILAAFQMEEIIYELRAHSSGLNCGRWDYIFSVIKKFQKHREFILPDRKAVTMTVPFMKAYVDLLIQTCHKRGVHAMGGMAAQIPIKGDEAANKAAMDQVAADKLREVLAGHDGTWVAHPALVVLAKEIFDRHMPGPNQLSRQSVGLVVEIPAKALLQVQIPGAKVTEAGLVSNVSVALQYMEAWISGNGCVPIQHLMEDAATAEISRCQIWQWLHHAVPIHRQQDAAPTSLTSSWFLSILDDQVVLLSAGKAPGTLSSLHAAKEKLSKLILAETCPEFLTTECYPLIAKDLPLLHSKL